MVLNIHSNHEAYQGQEEAGEGGMEVGKEGDDIQVYRYTLTTRMTRIKNSSNENHFNVSLIVTGKVTRHCPQFLKRKVSQSGTEPRPFCLPA